MLGAAARSGSSLQARRPPNRGAGSAAERGTSDRRRRPMSALQRNSSGSRSSHAGAPPAAGKVGSVGGITIVLADDHPVVRRGLRTVLAEAGIELVAEAADTAEARRKVLLALDLSMPGGSSLEAVAGLLESRRTRPSSS